MPKFVGVEPLGSLNVIEFRHIFTGVNALLPILSHPVYIVHACLMSASSLLHYKTSFRQKSIFVQYRGR